MKMRIMTWLRKETVLVVSALLAAGSCFLVKPDEEYLSYFSGNTDTILEVWEYFVMWDRAF